jgi:rhamnosyltransferase
MDSSKAADTLISIIVLTRNEEKNIKECLTGVFSQETAFSFEVVLIDSESDDRTLEIANAFPLRIHRIRRDEFHHGKTRNLGAQLAKGSILIYLAGDAYPLSRHWLNNLVSPLMSDSTVAAVYGKHEPKPGCNPINRFRLSWNYPEEACTKKEGVEFDHAHRLYFFSTVNCAIRKEVWEQNPFPEEITIFEDTAFSKKVLGAGFAIRYEPSATVLHSHNLGVFELFSRYRLWGMCNLGLNLSRNWVRVFQRKASYTCSME